MAKVRVSDSDHKEINILRRNKTQEDFIHILLSSYKQHDVLRKEKHELEAKIEKLRSEKPTEADKTSCRSVVQHPDNQSQSAQNPTKEDYLKSIQENNPPYEPINSSNPLSVECYYHAYNPQTKKHYCEEKPIDGYACLRRFQRYQSMKRPCVPVGRKKKSKPTQPYIPQTGNVFRGHEEKGAW